MRNTSPQHYKAKGQEFGIDPAVLENSVKAIQRIKAINPQLFPLLTLNHLCKETGVSYGYLRKIVARKANPYRHYLMKKAIPGRKNKRMISIPAKRLLICQKWIAQNILKFGVIHSNSYAYHPGSNPVFAAHLHVNSEWLIKVDIQDFFHAISEHKVYAVFQSLGYSRLLSLELARLCTMSCERHASHSDPNKKYGKDAIQYYKTPYVGILPQGAPTSPMLSNLVMREIDEQLATLAYENNMRFSRYADDIVFSCTDKRNKTDLRCVKQKILTLLNRGGFRPNLRKTVIRGPGTRKVVLGMLVDGPKPKLKQDLKDIIRLHLHYLTHQDYGPASHAQARKTSISKIYHHVLGLLYWAKAVEPEYGGRMLEKFYSVKWPPITKTSFFDPDHKNDHYLL